MSAVLEVEDLRVYYHTRQGPLKAVDGVSFTLEQGERLGLVGESGSGKSTTGLAILRLIKPPGNIESGSVRLSGVEVMSLSEPAMRRIRLGAIALVAQGAMNSLNPVMRVGDQIIDALIDHGVQGSRKAFSDRIAVLFERVGLQRQDASRFPHELSGGMKQRVCIALAISLSPRVIVADEPTSALDVVVQRQVMDTLTDVQSELRAAVILIGHDMGLMAQFVDRLGVMYAGELVEVSPMEEVYEEPLHPYTRLLIACLPSLEQKGVFAGIPWSTAIAAQPAAGLPVQSALSTRDGALSRRAASASGSPARPLGRLPPVRVMTTLLEARHVGKIFSSGIFARRQTRALVDFSMRIDAESPSITAIVGESGSGKTTLARLLLGLIAPTSGDVHYLGKPLQHMTGQERRAFRRDVQVIFQDPYDAYNPFYRVDHVLAKPIANFRLARSRSEARALIEQVLEAVGLRPEETLGRYPHQLSGGQRQRIMVARALLASPRVIIADEPVSMVDASLRATILGSLRKLNQEFGISVVYITHDLTTAYQISQNIVVLYGGALAEAGDVELVVRQPKHPYTQLLIGSIPSPNPRHRWTARRTASDVEALLRANGACRFAPRCPSAMPKCWAEQPPLFQADPHRVVACYLHESAPTAPDDALDQVFVR